MTGEIAAALLEAIVEAVPRWVTRTVEMRAAANAITLELDDRRRIDEAAEQLLLELTPRLERVLAADVDDGAGSPLAVLRSATGSLNDLLDELGVIAPPRDEFAASRFPDDRHDVGPATFADIDPAVHEPGLLWGAERAHIHLSRRR